VHFFSEFARRHGDYAIVGLAAQALLSGDQFTDLRLGFFAVGDRPLLAVAAKKLTNVAVTQAVLSDAAAVLNDELNPQQDQQASPAMRRPSKNTLARCVSLLCQRSQRECLRDGLSSRFAKWRTHRCACAAATKSGGFPARLSEADRHSCRV
jgi:CO/xanthine dehydrogenase FAD-binding subunit